VESSKGLTQGLFRVGLGCNSSQCSEKNSSSSSREMVVQVLLAAGARAGRLAAPVLMGINPRSVRPLVNLVTGSCSKISRVLGGLGIAKCSQSSSGASLEGMAQRAGRCHSSKGCRMGVTTV
jgi:hypothetical protein